MGSGRTRRVAGARKDVDSRDTPTLLASYLRMDAETIMQVVLNPTMRLAAVK